MRCKRPPVTLLPQITNRQNGKFEAAHSRKKRIQQTSTVCSILLIMPEYKTMSIGCDLSHSPVMLIPQITNRQNGEFEAAHSRKKGYRKLNRLQYPFNYA